MNRIAIFLALTILFLSSLLTACDKAPKLTPLESDAIILAFGDSLTYGTGTQNPKTESYPAVLSQLINRTVINAGIPGEVSQLGLERLPELLQQHQPQLVILCHGANDILRKQNISETEKNLRKMIKLIQQSGAQVVLMAVPDFNLTLQPADFYQRIADKYKLPIENTIISKIERKPKLKSDNVHPNTEGYTLIAEKMAALLKKSGGI